MKKFLAAILAFALLLGTLKINPAVVRAADMDENPIVIVLDPGHGGSDSGAARTWGGRRYREKDMNLKIAKYCKEELEQYAGVEVYLTRENDTYVSLSGRVQTAARLNADLFVSLHNNADYRTSKRGACVFYPNTKYRKTVSTSGRGAAECIQSRLVALGMKNNGIAFRNSENKTKYPNKQTADYYYVIRESKLLNIPGIIVEHAYVSNPTDCRQFFSTDAKLKKLGVADAKGLADYYGLRKGTDVILTGAESQPDASVCLEWEEADEMDGYAVYRRLSGEEEFERIAAVEDVETTSYTDNSASEAGVYEYCVRAYVVCSGAERYTAYSDILSAARVPAPLWLALEQTEGAAAALSWDTVYGAHGYVIERRCGEEEEFSEVAQIADAEQSFWTDDTAEPGIRYEYRICAYIDTEDERITGPYCLMQAPETETDGET